MSAGKWICVAGNKGSCAMGSTFAKITLITGFGVVLLLAALRAVLQALDRSDGKIVMGIPGPQYDELAKTYRRDLERHGVELELRQSTEGFATFTTLLDHSSG